MKQTDRLILKIVVISVAVTILPATLQADDVFPAGTISFFNREACPSGWRPLDLADGRLVVSLMPGGGAGATVGDSLGNMEDRVHKHPIEAYFSTTSTDYALIGSGGNKSLAKSGSYTISGTAIAASTGLPYVQLLMCVKHEVSSGDSAVLPRGLLIYFSGVGFGCEEGWSVPLTNQGRFMVGLPEHGSPGAVFGGTSLGPQLQNKNDHPVTGDISLARQSIAGVAGCCADGYAKAGQYPYNGTAAEVSSDLPFIQMLQCQKD